MLGLLEVYLVLTGRSLTRGCLCRTLQLNTRRYYTSGKLPRRNHYQVLGIKQTATQEDIRAAFVAISKEVHPDLNPNDPLNHNKFVRLNEAYNILNKPSTRREYDVGLAYRLKHYNNLARTGYGRHTPGESHTPGAEGPQGFGVGDEQQRMYWEETIWHMRDKSRDPYSYYPPDQYYGVKGIKRMSNTAILMGCFFLIGVGIVLHLTAIRYSTHFSVKVLDENDRINLSHLHAARERARAHGNTRQLEILNQQFKANAGKWNGQSDSKD